MKGLSQKEIKIISWLEFDNRYFFTSKDIEKFSKDRTQRYNIVKSLIKKKRIIKLNRMKYYLVPIKAKSGSWVEHPFILADEICNGTDYFIGGWGAANYWGLTEQIPMQTDIYTTRRQGKIYLMNTRMIFHRTTKKRIGQAAVEEVENHKFRILNKKEAKKWLRSRS